MAVSIWKRYLPASGSYDTTLPNRPKVKIKRNGEVEIEVRRGDEIIERRGEDRSGEERSGRQSRLVRGVP